MRPLQAALCGALFSLAFAAALALWVAPLPVPAPTSTPTPFSDPVAGYTPLAYETATPFPKVLSTSYVENRSGDRLVFKAPRSGTLFTVEVQEVDGEELPALTARPPRQKPPPRPTAEPTPVPLVTRAP